MSGVDAAGILAGIGGVFLLVGAMEDVTWSKWVGAAFIAPLVVRLFLITVLS